MVGRAYRVEKPLRRLVGVRVASRSKRREHAAGLCKCDRDVRAGWNGHALCLGCRALGGFFVSARAGDDRVDRLRCRDPLRLAELVGEPPALLCARNRHVPIGDPRGHAALKKQQAWKMSEPSFGAQAIDRGAEERECDVEGADDDCCRPKKARGVCVLVQVCGGCAHSIEHGLLVAERVRVGLDREDPRLSGSWISEVSRRFDQRLPGGRRRFNPPGARGKQPQKVELEIAVARRARVLRGAKQRVHAVSVGKRSRERDFLDPRRARTLKRIGPELLHCGQHLRDGSPVAEFKRDLSAGEQTPDTLIRSAQLRGTLKRSHRHRESSTPPRPCRCFLELARNVLVDAADQRGAVPDSPIRVFPQHFGQRLVNASALRQANLLTNS